MTADVLVEVLSLDQATALRNAWDELATRSLEPNIFAEAGFVLPAARHLSRGAEPSVLAAWLGGIGAHLVGVAPVAGSRIGVLGPARVWTHAQAVAAMPLLDHAHGHQAWQAMRAAVGAMPGRPAALLLGGVALGGATAALVAGSGAAVHVLDDRSRAVLKPGASGSGLGSKPRKELRRQWSRLAERGPLSFSTASEPAAVATALDRFLRLEAKGWKGRRGTALGSQPGTRAFMQSAIGHLAARGQVGVASLDLAGEAIAMGVVLRSRTRAFFWKTAYDEAFARHSPGLQLTLWLTDQLRTDQTLVLADSCAVPGHSMIDRVWPDRIAVADLLVATGEGRTRRFGWAVRAEQTRRSLRLRAMSLRDAWISRTR